MPEQDSISRARTFLFVPGNRPERFAKAVAAQPDRIVIDLEDAVPAEEKDRARESARSWLAAGNDALIRINGHQTEWYESDLALIEEFGAATMLPKAEAPTVVAEIARASLAGLVALIESAAGALAAPEIARSAGVTRLAFGHIDFSAESGLDPNTREALLWTRSMLVVASTSAGLAAPIDGVTTGLDDPAVLRDDLLYARRLGFGAKLCIHPAQVPLVHELSQPTADEIAWAQRVIAANDPDGAATAVDGEMVDVPVIKRAERILAAAQDRS